MTISVYETLQRIGLRMSIFLLGLVLFVAIHCVRIAAPAFREAQIERFGDGGWKGIYTVLSLLGFAALIYGWSSARQESGLLYIPIDGLKIVNYLGMLIAFVLLVASQIPAGHIKAKTKHPMMIAVLVWSVGHLLSNGDTATELLIGVFLVRSIYG